jgi:hypothetical protein
MDRLGRWGAIGLVLLLAATGAVVLGVAFSACNGNSRPTQQTTRPGIDSVHVELAGEPFELELAVTDAQRTRGLKGRPSIDSNGGMLFVFPEADVRRFWMRDCLVPLDILFIDSDGKIDSIHTLPPAPPGTPRDAVAVANSVGAVPYVIELRSGRADELGLSRGDVISLPTERLKRLAR